MSKTPKSRPPSGRANNIHVISQLHEANPPKWESMLNRLEEDEKMMALAYVPLRQAILTEAVTPGRGQRLLRLALSLRKATPAHKKIAEVSVAALEIFITSILPLIETVENQYLTRKNRPAPFQVGEYPISGSFHAKVKLRTGGIAYLYLHASQWPSSTEDTFLELLAMLGEQIYRCERDQVWFVDLRSGVIRKPATAYKKRRKDLESTVKHLNHFLA